MAQPTLIEREPVQMPVAAWEGQLLWVNDAPNGLYPGVVCLCCEHSVVAKQGDVNQWHFAHAPVQVPHNAGSREVTPHMPIPPCTRESYLHASAIRVICDAVEGAITQGHKLPLRYGSDCFHGEHSYEDIITKSPPTLRVNTPFENIRPDITVVRKGRVTAFIEVVVTHKPELAVYAQRLPVIQVELRGMSDLTRLRHELFATCIANNPKWCRDQRRACRQCGGLNTSEDLPTCSRCRKHDCPECGRVTYSPSPYCSKVCAASAKDMDICQCGRWHSIEYDECYECSGR